MTKKQNFAEAYRQQKSEGVDIKDPMANLITGTKSEQREPAEIPADFHTVERRKRRVQLVLPQSLYEQVKGEADRIGISFNEFIVQLCMKVTQ